MNKNNNNSGFTLVELMVVAVIVAILAAVAIPLMSGNRDRAILTEAQAGCGTIRSALRANYSQAKSYAVDSEGGAIVTAFDLEGLAAGDLDGKYFQDAEYALVVGATTYSITATDAGTGITVSLDQDGGWTLP